MDQCKYNVVFEPFAERHFMKSFAKKYKSKWMKTRDYIEFLCVDDRLGLVRVLLVYAKTDLPSRNETQEWKRLVKDEYGDVKEIFNL